MSLVVLHLITTSGMHYEVDVDEGKIRWSDQLDALNSQPWYDIVFCEDPQLGQTWSLMFRDPLGTHPDRPTKRITSPIQAIEWPR